MQPRNAFRPCLRCGIRIAHDLVTGDPMEQAGEEYGRRPLYRWHLCPGKLNRADQQAARDRAAAELALRQSPRLREIAQPETPGVAPRGSK
jgi:hypothetical protein